MDVAPNDKFSDKFVLSKQETVNKLLQEHFTDKKTKRKSRFKPQYVPFCPIFSIS
jgi:hypothetical protein